MPGKVFEVLHNLQKTLVAILIVIILLTAAGCSDVQQYFTSSTLETIKGNTCNTPCWHGIIPGETTSNDALLLLANVPGIEKDKIYSSAQQREGYLDMVRGEFSNGYYCELELSNKTVTAIVITGKYYLRDLIALYGEPDYVMIAPGFNYHRVIYLYSKKYIYFVGDYKVLNAKEVKVESSSVTDMAVFVMPANYNDNIKSYYQGFKKGRDNPIEFFMQPWDGYGKVSIIPWW